MLTENIPVFAVPENLFVDQAKLVATRDRLEAAGVEFCLSTYVDIHGVPKGEDQSSVGF